MLRQHNKKQHLAVYQIAELYHKCQLEKHQTMQLLQKRVTFSPEYTSIQERVPTCSLTCSKPQNPIIQKNKLHSFPWVGVCLTRAFTSDIWLIKEFQSIIFFQWSPYVFDRLEGFDCSSWAATGREINVEAFFQHTMIVINFPLVIQEPTARIE